MQNILSRSRLNHLHVVCSTIEPTLSELINIMLQSVRCDELSSLFLSGDNIEEWIQFWASNITPQLRRLDICGAWLDPQRISHSRVLAVQQVVNESPLVELNLSNVELQDKHDWMVLVDSMDLSILTTFGLNSSCRNQFVSNVNAVDLYHSIFPKKVMKTTRV